MLHQTGVFEVKQFGSVIGIFVRPTRLPWQRKFGNFNGKMAKTRLIQEIEPQMLHQTWGFRGLAICWCHWNLVQTDPGRHGNENLGILTKKWQKFG